MLSKLAKNAIIKGPLESFCIVCECRLEIPEKIHAHLEDGTHEKKLAAYPHLEKYDGDHIRKIKSVYFCEFCSVILHTTTKVNMHVTTKEHRDNKGAHKLRPGPDNGVLAFDDVYIRENAWHSIRDGSCSICGIEYDQAAKHKKEPNHLLRLALVKVEFVENGLYRKTDKDIFQCLTCNREYEINILNDHFESNAHNEAFINSKLNNNSTELENVEGNSMVKAGNGKTEETVVTTGARPKDVPIDDKEEKKRFAEENCITYNVDHLNAYCQVCEIRMPATLKSMKEHANGSKHVNKLRTKKPRLTKQPINIFVDDMARFGSAVQNFFHHDVIINHRICIPLMNYAMIAKNSDQLRCLVCDVNMSEDRFNEHANFPKHKRISCECSVVTTFDGEFLREVRPGTFHCGYCNMLIPSWDEVEGHLDSADHKYKRVVCENRLKEHLPELHQHEERQQLGAFLRMLRGGWEVSCNSGVLDR